MTRTLNGMLDTNPTIYDAVHARGSIRYSCLYGTASGADVELKSRRCLDEGNYWVWCRVDGRLYDKSCIRAR